MDVDVYSTHIKWLLNHLLYLKFCLKESQCLQTRALLPSFRVIDQKLKIKLIVTDNIILFKNRSVDTVVMAMINAC